jgi:nicotinamide-nucleotide amidase
MFCEFVLPLLQDRMPPAAPFACRTVRTIGLGESLVADRIETSLRPFVTDGLQLGYCARPGEVDVRLAARGAQAIRLVAEAEVIVQCLLSEQILSAGDDAIEAVIIRELTASHQTLALAESCTGGYVAHRLTNVPGASAVLMAALTTYSNEAKQRYLGVRAETLSGHGAVSEPVAREMAEGARRSSGTDLGLSITGIAGPGGGSPDKPVGTVFIGLSCSAGTRVWRMHNPWDRLTFKEVTAHQAMARLLRLLRNGLQD